MFEETFKSFEINVNALNEKNTFSCGDILSGRITFETSKQVKINSIVLVVKGKAKVYWSKGSGKNRRHYSARVEYFTITSQLMQRNNVAVGADSNVLPKGTHVYPFSLQIPQGNFPSSFKGNNGSVMYYVTVAIHRPWHLAKEFRTDFSFISHIDANHPQLLAPLAAVNGKTLSSFCCTFGSISMSIRIERKGYVPGDEIKILAEFENDSSETLVPKASLVREQVFYTLSRVSSCRIYTEVAKIRGNPIVPHSSDVWNNQIVRIPDHTPYTISNCQILEVSYSLLVKLCVPRQHNLEVLFPLVICSIPVYSEPS